MLIKSKAKTKQQQGFVSTSFAVLRQCFKCSVATYSAIYTQS